MYESPPCAHVADVASAYPASLRAPELTAAGAAILAEVARSSAIDADVAILTAHGRTPEDARAIAEDTHRTPDVASIVQAARPDYVTNHDAWTRWYREHIECRNGSSVRCYHPREPGSLTCAHHAAERAA